MLEVHLASNALEIRQRLGKRNPSSKTISGASSEGMRGGTITDSPHCGQGQPRPTNFSEARSRQRHDGQRNEMRSRITSSSKIRLCYLLAGATGRMPTVQCGRTDQTDTNGIERVRGMFSIQLFIRCTWRRI